MVVSQAPTNLWWCSRYFCRWLLMCSVVRMSVTGIRSISTWAPAATSTQDGASASWLERKDRSSHG